MKKLVCVLLVFAMVLAMGTAVLADDAGKGTITVENAVDGQNYTAYKIFDVTYSGKAYAYTISEESEWYEVVKDYADGEDSGLVLEKSSVSGVYNVTITEGTFSAPDFAAALSSKTAGMTGVPLILDDGKAKATGLKLGYYFVASTTGALCNLTTTDPDAVIYDKNDRPFDKTDDKENVDLGETVIYTVTGKVPDTTGFTQYTYLITDTMSEGLTFDKNVKVKVNGEDVTGDCTITYNVEGNANKFTVSIPVMDYNAGEDILVTYTAMINEKAVAKVENNQANLTYSNNPSDTTSTAKTPDEVETVYTAKIVINKYAKEDETKLAGAEFVLYKEVTVEGQQEPTKVYYVLKDGVVSWTENIDEATHKTTDADGAASFDGVADGTYYLEEIKAPEGYNLLKEAVEVEVQGATVNEADVTYNLTVTKDIANSSGTELPSTGGMGTTVFYVVGSVLVLAAVVLLVTRKRMNAKS